MIFLASLLTGTKHSAFSTNHLTDIDNTKPNNNTITKQPDMKTTVMRTVNKTTG